jgi:hypothetical protein
MRVRSAAHDVDGAFRGKGGSEEVNEHANHVDKDYGDWSELRDGGLLLVLLLCHACPIFPSRYKKFVSVPISS